MADIITNKFIRSEEVIDFLQEEDYLDPNEGVSRCIVSMSLE